MNYGVGAYKRTSVETASREQVLLMLYQAAIKNCKRAMTAIEENNINDKGVYIGKLQDIVIELDNSLDFKVNNDISTELSSLYDYIIHASTQANIHLNKKELEGCLNVLNTLYNGWSTAIKSLKNG